MMIFQKGQKAKLVDLGLGSQFVVSCDVVANFPFDVSCFGLDQNDKLSDDRYMVFYNVKNSPNNEIKMLQDVPNSKFELNLSALPPQIVKLVFTAVIDGTSVMKELNSLKFKIGEHEFNLDGSNFDKEKAVMIAEIYQKDGVWRVGANGQGFNGGMHALLTHFGGVAAEDVAPAPVVQSTPVDLKKKVFLEKRVSLEKTLEKDAPKLLSLSKKAAVSLEKRGLGEHKAKVALCLDISASMSKLYSSGQVQEFAERILALACRLDDDGSIDIFLFGEEGYQPAPLTVKDFSGYISRMLKTRELEYGTCYAKAVELVRKFYATPYRYERSEPLRAEVPVYVMFITDGQNSDKMACTKALKNSSYEPIFWQFMGLSSPGVKFDYLEKLDDLPDRYIDNADFFSVNGVSELSDDQLYDKLMNEYPAWLKEAKTKDLIV